MLNSTILSFLGISAFMLTTVSDYLGPPAFEARQPVSKAMLRASRC
jgi:hypothetical protein